MTASLGTAADVHCGMYFFDSAMPYFSPMIGVADLSGIY
jgi:hypothetical protein